MLPNQTRSKSSFTVLPNVIGTQEAVIFVIPIPWVPDFLLDHTLLGETDLARLEEVLNRFRRFILGLHKYKKSAYAIRFISNPGSGDTEITLICRFLVQSGQGKARYQQYWSDICAHLTSYGIPHLPLESVEDSVISESLNPFVNPVFVELRQFERIVPLLTINKEAYVIHPYWKATGSFLEPFEVMLRQSSPVAVNVYIEPTELSEEESQALSEASYLAQTVADLDAPVLSTTGIRRKRDPGAELVGRIYSCYLNSLDDPFILTVQVVSTDANSAWTVARAYSSNVTGQNNPIENSDENRLPSGSRIISPVNSEEQARAVRTFSQLLWSPWGTSLASQNKERFQYLCGSLGATAAFRFPINVRGGIPGIPVRQQAPDFDPGRRVQLANDKQIHIGNMRRGGAAVISLNDLSRHTLITGFTGSGKTNTVLYLLQQAWKEHQIPFLVIEAAKKEYRGLLNHPGFGNLLVFSLGDETTSPFRLNPFELIPGVRLEAHLGRLQSCFDAALPQFGILPSIIAEALESIYKQKGWKLTEKSGEDNQKLFPTMRDMFSEVIKVAEKRGYAGETYHNIRAAAAGRIGGLLRGSRGRMFGCQHSFPAEELFSRPVILELNDLTEDDKALTMMYLLTWLREYRELHPSNQVQHLTVVEEAHNVLSNTTSVGNTEVAADTKAKSVATFSNMLSEVRAYGEGIIISDQSPEKLAPDAMRNTNLQIAHQLRDRRDREAISRAMIMDERQSEFLGKLRVGEAALFQTGLERATFISIPEFKDSAGFEKQISDAEVRHKMEPFQSRYLQSSLPFDGCRFCGSPCHFREDIEPQTFDQENHEKLIQALSNFNSHPEQEYWDQNWLEVTRVCGQVGKKGGHPGKIDASYCYLAHEIDFQFTKHMRLMFEKSHDRITKEG